MDGVAGIGLAGAAAGGRLTHVNFAPSLIRYPIRQ